MCVNSDLCICKMKLDAIRAAKVEELSRHRAEMIRIGNEEATLKAQMVAMVGERRKLRVVK